MAREADIERAWAAGFFDGEGCFSTSQQPQTARGMHIRTTITQNDRRALDRFCAAVGVGKVAGPYTHGKGPDDVRYSYTANGRRSVTHVIAELWPFLGDIKREQAMRTLSRFDDARPLGVAPDGTRTHCPNGHPYADDTPRRANGSRRCVTCSRAHGARASQRQRETLA